MNLTVHLGTENRGLNPLFYNSIHRVKLGPLHVVVGVE